MRAAPSRPVFSVAPMMDRTDRHFRYLARCISRRAVLYTEMVTADAVVHGDRERLLGFDPREHPVVVQLGGLCPRTMARAARIAVAMGYDAVNINVGCPSDRVQAGRFGACLMLEPATVAAIVRAVSDAVPVPVTVKHRIGVDRHDRYEDMLAFVDAVAAAGCRHFIVHARKAWLSGLSPKQNRTIPPLRPEDVYRLARERPGLFVEYNGGVQGIDQALAHLEHVSGVMVGRAFYDRPMDFGQVDARIFGDRHPPPSVPELLEEVAAYARRQAASGVPVRRVARHLPGLVAGARGARVFRRVLGELAYRPDARPDAILRARDAWLRAGAAGRAEVA